MLKHAVAIHWSDEDQMFIAEVPELPGCMADGDTKAAALSAAERIAAEWLEAARELGREIPQPGGRLRFA